MDGWVPLPSQTVHWCECVMHLHKSMLKYRVLPPASCLNPKGPECVRPDGPHSPQALFLLTNVSIPHPQIKSSSH